MDLSKIIDSTLLGKAIDKCEALFADKDSVSAIEKSLNTHTGNSTIHVTETDKSRWDDAAELKTYIRVKSSTPNSTKVFRITIDDNGIITGEEETE